MGSFRIPPMTRLPTLPVEPDNIATTVAGNTLVTFAQRAWPSMAHALAEAEQVRAEAPPDSWIYDNNPTTRPNAITTLDPHHPSIYLRLPSAVAAIGVVAKRVRQVRAARGDTRRYHATVDAGRRGVPVPDEMDTAWRIAYDASKGAHARALWQHYGRKVYSLDRASASLLSETDVPSFPAEWLKMPLPSFYLALPPNYMHAGITDVNGGSRLTPIAGVFVSMDTAPAGQESVYERALTLSVVSDYPLGMQFDRPVNAALIDGAAFDIPLWPDRPLTEVATGRGYDDSERAMTAPEDGLPTLIVNFLLYLSSSHPVLRAVPPLPAMRRPAAAGQKGAPFVPIKQTGLTRLAYVQVDAAFVSPAEPSEPSRASESGRHLTAPSWTRGHWRHVRFGHGRTERRLQWIRPFRRGPDVAEVVHSRVGAVSRPVAAAAGLHPEVREVLDGA